MNLARWTRVAWWLVPVIYTLLLAAPSVTLPGDELGIRRFETPPLSQDLRLGQTFTMTGDGLHAIEVFPVAVEEGVSGEVRFELYEARNNQLHPVRIAVVLAEDVVRSRSYRFEFAPIPDSRDRTYRLDLVASPAEGVAFKATRGDRYRGGSMHANGRERWADLAFRVHAPAPSVWGRLMTLRDTNPARAYVVMGAFVAIWLLLGLVLRLLTAIPPEPGRAGSPRAA